MSGIPTAVPAWSHVTYECPEGLMFQHNIYAPPVMRLTCTDDGDFDGPDFWPVCVDIDEKRELEFWE